MEWLRKIIETAKIEDGKIDIEAVMKQVNAEFPKNAVPKAEFNKVNGELKTANATIEDLKENAKGDEDLQQKIKEYEAEIESLKTESELQAKSFTLKAKLSEKGVLDADYLIYKHGGVEKFAFDEKNEPMGIDDVLKTYKESIPHLFKGEEKQGYNPKRGENENGINPWAKETFNLTKQGEIYKENPAQAKELAAQAGITI